MSEQWVKETMELIEDGERRRDFIRQKRMELEEEESNLDKSITAWHELLAAYLEKHNILMQTTRDIKANNLANKSYPDMLITIAQERQGILSIAEAVDILFKANVGKDKKSIRNNIYSALHREKKHFARIALGQYRYINHRQEKGSSKSSGLRNAIKELKERNPTMTKQAVLKHLINTGFDFRGKRPTQAVNITWAFLGYSKEGKQQSFLSGT